MCSVFITDETPHTNKDEIYRYEIYRYEVTTRDVLSTI